MLLELLFRMHERRPAVERLDGPRRRSLALLLDALEPTESPQEQILQRLLDWALGRGQYAPPEPLMEEAHGYAVLTLRCHFRHALETIWAAFGRLIEIHQIASLDLKPFLAAILDEADPTTPSTPSGERRVADVVAEVGDAPQLESELRDEIEESLEENPGRAALIAASLLAVIARRVEQLADPSRHYRLFLDLGDPDHVSMLGFARRGRPDDTVEQWLRHLLERCAIAQHFITGTRKQVRGIDGFFFHPTERGYELTAGVWWPDAGPTKVWAGISMLTELGLVALDEDRYGTTAAGRDQIAAVLADPGERVVSSAGQRGRV